MESSLNLPFEDRQDLVADGIAPGLLRIPGSGCPTHDWPKHYSQDTWSSRTAFKTSSLAPSESDALRVFLGESYLEDDSFWLPHEYDILDPLSSGLVGSLSAGSAGMIETQIALSNCGSTHQTSRWLDHMLAYNQNLFDYNRLCDLPRGLLHPFIITSKTLDLPGYETGHSRQRQNFSENAARQNYSLEQTPHMQEPNNLIFPSPGVVVVLPVQPQTIHENREVCALQDNDQFFGQALGLYSENAPKCSKSCPTINNQEETRIRITYDQSPGDLNSWFDSSNGFLNSLNSEGNAHFSSMESSLSSSSTSSPGAGSTTITTGLRQIYAPKRRRQVQGGGSENCQYCDASFLRPSELRRHTAKHILPYKCPDQGCTCAFAQRKDLDRHLNTRKHWQNENEPLPRVFCHFKGCKFATEGFSRRDNLLRHARRVHGRTAQECDVEREAQSS